MIKIGPIDPDYDDVRIFHKAASAGVKRALKAGSKQPLLVLFGEEFKNGKLVTILGALDVLYTVRVAPKLNLNNYSWLVATTS